MSAYVEPASESSASAFAFPVVLHACHHLPESLLLLLLPFMRYRHKLVTSPTCSRKHTIDHARAQKPLRHYRPARRQHGPPHNNLIDPSQSRISLRLRRRIVQIAQPRCLPM